MKLGNGVKRLEKSLLQLPYEREAMLGMEMPGGLDVQDQILFLQLRLLYRSYKNGEISRDMAKSEKKKLLAEYRKSTVANESRKRWVELIKRTEEARSEYRREKSIENADRLLKSIDGVL